jgi:predicted metalloprotease with PDZ domain
MRSLRNNLRGLVLALATLLAMGSIAAADDTPAAPEPSGLPFAGFGQEPGSYLGIDPQDITQDRITQLKLKEDRGVEVMMVDQDAPAGKAGIKEHDVILEFNHVPVQSVAQLRRMLQETPPGRTVEIGLSRDGQPQTVQVTLANKIKTIEAWQGPERSMLQMPVDPVVVMPDIPNFDIFKNLTCGLSVESLSPQLGNYFGVKSGHGILVRSVEKGSAADTAGFKAGDVITQVGNEPVSNSGDLMMALRHYQSRSAKITVMREHRQRWLELKVPANSQGWPTGTVLSPEMERKLHDTLQRLSDQQIAMGDLQKKLHDEITSKGNEQALARAEQALAQRSVQQALAQLPKQEAQLRAMEERIQALAASQAEQHAMENAQRALQQLQQKLNQLNVH